MERQPPSKILQLKCSMYHAIFCIKYETTGPRGVLGDCPILSMYVGYHSHGYPTAFTFFARHRV